MTLPENLSPHRMRFDTETAAYESYTHARTTAPYQKGDIVAVCHNGKLKFALIDNVLVERRSFGEYRPYWRVRFMRKDGSFPAPYKRQPYIYPGYVQRGYWMAGLAPEIPEGVFQ